MNYPTRKPRTWVGDGSGYEAQGPAGGAEVERWDAYGQPAGIHYRPHADNCAFQGAAWLDFQWCQTGHSGEHMPERVMAMWHNRPIKAVTNGEPTYERGGQRDKAAGWWQGHEVWSNLCAGGTLGVVYGAGSLWQWRLHANEPGHAPFFLAEEAGWCEAPDFEGSKYVGLLTRILEGLPFADMEPNWQVTLGRRGLLVPGKFFLCYSEMGGPLKLFGTQFPARYRVVDPRTGDVLRAGIIDPNWAPPGLPNTSAGNWIPDEEGGPRFYLCY